MKVLFKNPGKVSRGNDKDEMQIKIKELSLFKTAHDASSLDPSTFEGGKGVIAKSVPPIIDKESAVKIESSTQRGG